MSLCECGCGQLAPIARDTDSRRGHRKGQPKRFIWGHSRRGQRVIREIAGVVAAHVTPASADTCWPWEGHLDSYGYGVVSISGRQRKAHRVAYEVAKGPIADGLVVRHSCDNPPCCNPAHLLVGSVYENNQDKVRRNRQSLGERHGQARLTESDVIAIRTRRAAGEQGKALALEFGVSESNIRFIVRGITWKHVELSA